MVDVPPAGGIESLRSLRPADRGAAAGGAISESHVVMHILTPHRNFNHGGQNAFYSVEEYAGP